MLVKPVSWSVLTITLNHFGRKKVVLRFQEIHKTE